MSCGVVDGSAKTIKESSHANDLRLLDTLKSLNTISKQSTGKQSKWVQMALINLQTNWYNNNGNILQTQESDRTLLEHDYQQHL